MPKTLKYIAVLLGLFISPVISAVPIGYFPGLTKLIDAADAIVVLRIDRHLSGFDSPTLYSTHECFIYQTLKGDIPKDSRIKLQLMDTVADFATPYAHGSTHLMFLMKKARGDEPTDYRTITFKGAQILLPPLGNEKMPSGDTLEGKIRNVIKAAIEYENQQHEKKQALLESMLDEQIEKTRTSVYWGVNNDLPEDALIARVLDQKIYLKDINPPQEQMEKYAKDTTPEQAERWLSQYRRSNLSHYFWPLFEKYAQEKKIIVSETDIEQFNERMRQNMMLQAEKAQKKADSLQKELQADNLDDKKRSELTGRLALYSNIVTRMAESEGLFKSHNSAAEKMILIWKIYNRLYEQYGGRVIFQQAGPEPLDAYRSFLEDAQRKGDFEFFNKEAEDLFWEYYRNEKMHTFISDAAKAKAMMETPWWLREPDQSLAEENDYLWGDAADGLCMKIRTTKLVFNTEETVTVIGDLLNIGDKIFMCSSCEQFFEIEVDGRWYQWDGPEAFDILSFPSSPKKIQYEFAQIKLTEEWEFKETALPLKLDEGQHSLRLRYRPMYVMDKNDDAAEAARARLYKNYKPVEVTPVTSNLVKFKIVPFEEPLSIVLEGQRETIDRVGQWLGRNPKIVRPVLGQSYRARMRPLNPQNNKAMTDAANSTDMSFTIKILDSSGNRMSPELEEKLAELIRKQLQEQFQKP